MRSRSKAKADTILIIEDNPASRAFLNVHLTDYGYKTLQSDGADGVEALLEQESVDLVLLDIVLPDRDGLSLLKSLRQKRTSVGLPVILLTAKAASRDIVEGLSLGANDYVTKPADPDVLLARVKTHLLLKHAKEDLLASEERYSLAVLGANDGIWDWDLRSNEIYLSQRWKTQLGFTDGEFPNSMEEWERHIHYEDLPAFKQAVKLQEEGLTDHLEVEYRMSDRSGQFRWMLTRGQAVRDPGGKAYRMAGSQTDITESKLTDALSGLPNRILFMDRLTQAIKHFRRQLDATFAVCVLNIDRFNLVNESLGHPVGDQVLKEFARRLLECLRPEDTVAHLGGDDYVILIEGLRNHEHIPTLVDRIRQRMVKPFKVQENEIFVTFGVGIVYGDPSYQRAEEVIRDANTALHRAKTNGAANFGIFDPAMHARVMKRFEVESQLRRALERTELFLCYQPICRGERHLGYEALVRWNNPNQAEVMLPDHFIPIAEETGLIVPLGESILITACTAIKELQAKAFAQAFVAVNFSARQFQQSNVTDMVERTLKITGLDPSSLKIELTESVLMDNSEEAIRKLWRFRDMNMQISIDDFGTGYSSLSYLKRFPITTLKIDKSFVKDIAVDPNAASIVRAIIALAHSLNLDVVAEGVEDRAQVDFLQDQGCDAMQGFFFSVPMTVEELQLHWASKQTAFAKGA